MRRIHGLSAAIATTATLALPAIALATNPLPNHHPSNPAPALYEYDGNDNGPQKGAIGEISIFRHGSKASVELYDSECGEFSTGWNPLNGRSFHFHYTGKNGYGLQGTGTFAKNMKTVTGTISSWGGRCHTPVFDYNTTHMIKH